MWADKVTTVLGARDRTFVVQSVFARIPASMFQFLHVHACPTGALSAFLICGLYLATVTDDQERGAHVYVSSEAAHVAGF